MRSCKLCLILFILTVLPLSSFAMRCGHDLVSLGETSTEVILKCGPPYTQEIIGIEYEGGGDPSLFPRSEQFIEQWTYNLGRGTLLKVLTFKGGILSSIEDGERIDGGGVPQKRYIFTLGEYSAEILDRYGEPLTREFVGTESRNARGGVIEEKVERWVYNPGPGRFLQILTIRGGRLVKVETGARQ